MQKKKSIHSVLGLLTTIWRATLPRCAVCAVSLHCHSPWTSGKSTQSLRSHHATRVVSHQFWLGDWELRGCRWGEESNINKRIAVQILDIPAGSIGKPFGEGFPCSADCCLRMHVTCSVRRHASSGSEPALEQLATDKSQISSLYSQQKTRGIWATVLLQLKNN